MTKNLYLTKDYLDKDAPKKACREGIGLGLVEAAEKNPELIVLTADLKESTQVDGFAQKYPNRFIEMGISEQNMAGVAAGLALTGKIPVMASFAIFSPGRNWEQIRQSICINKANVKIVGSHAGLSHSKDGGMAQALEDLALTRTLPNLKVLSPLDYEESRKAVKEAIETQGPVYIRVAREKTPILTTLRTPFEIGKALVLKEGDNATVVGTGPILFEVLEAAQKIEKKHKISLEIINASSVKPLDEDTILASAEKTGRVVTIEDHQIAGGLGGTVAELLTEELPLPLLRLGMEDTFGESGTYKELLSKYKLDAKHLEQKILKFISKTHKLYG